MDDKKIVIIGAGIAGLVAALELEKKGYSPMVIEASDRVGGRVKTDYENGFQFDYGFQVLLTAYPEVRNYLDLDDLNLSYFNPGALIYDGKKKFKFADPLRQPSSLLAAIFSPVGSLSDKLKLWRLANQLKRKSITEIFASSSNTTSEYLRAFGFSDRIIRNFFRPFFSGIFLEKDLNTSSRLFEFIFKMFSEGYAAIPEKGMQDIPNQLYSKLARTEFLFDTKVENILQGEIETSNGNYICDAVILTAEPSKILEAYESTPVEFKSTVNLYFSTSAKNGEGYIGLSTTANSLINNIAVLSDVASAYASEGNSLISVSIVGKSDLNEDELVATARYELASIFKYNASDLKYLKSYFVELALPIVNEPVMELKESQIRHRKGVYLGGDFLLGGSLNGAMVAGRQCAETVIKDLTKID